MGKAEIYKDADGNIRIRNVVIKADDSNIEISPDGIKFTDVKPAKKPRKKKGDNNG